MVRLPSGRCGTHTISTGSDARAGAVALARVEVGLVDAGTVSRWRCCPHAHSAAATSAVAAATSAVAAARGIEGRLRRSMSRLRGADYPTEPGSSPSRSWQPAPTSPAPARAAGGGGAGPSTSWRCRGAHRRLTARAGAPTAPGSCPAFDRLQRFVLQLPIRWRGSSATIAADARERLIVPPPRSHNNYVLTDAPEQPGRRSPLLGSDAAG